MTTKWYVPDKTRGECSICGDEYHGGGHNAWPINDGRCCGMCNGNKVMDARLERIMRLPLEETGR
jgi:hypothetical protein